MYMHYDYPKGCAGMFGRTPDNIEYAASIVPTERQLKWQDLEFYAFIHFGINTFTDSEWGNGNEDPELFNPEKLDCRQWAKVCQLAGMKGIILTCKHHDGFCLWPSAYTDHCVRSSSWRDGKGDVVKECAKACKEFGLKFGIYVSPWDRHEPTYGSGEAYNKFFLNQLRELLTAYGDLFCVWFDGACGEGKNGKVQEYDWEGYYEVVRECQPDAVISLVGPDVRWYGNEWGVIRENEWSVVPEKYSIYKKKLNDINILIETLLEKQKIVPEVLENLKHRDYVDTYVSKALVKVDEAIVLDTTNMSFDEVVNYVIKLVEERV